MLFVCVSVLVDCHWIYYNIYMYLNLNGNFGNEVNFIMYHVCQGCKTITIIGKCYHYFIKNVFMMCLHLLKQGCMIQENTLRHLCYPTVLLLWLLLISFCPFINRFWYVGCVDYVLQATWILPFLYITYLFNIYETYTNAHIDGMELHICLGKGRDVRLQDI